MSPELDRGAQAQARSRLYGILARTLIRGVDPGILAELEALDGWLIGPVRDLDAIAAGHHACFHLGVFPYVGVFLSPEAGAGACSDRVRAFYEAAGFRPRLDELAADHLGIELAFLSFLAGAVAEAHEDGLPAVATKLEGMTAEFLDACVLPWLPALVVAAAPLESGPGQIWPQVLSETLELVAEHRAALAAWPPSAAGLLELDDQDPLADAKAGLRDIAAWLLTPARSGLFLTRTEVASLARGQALPRGFGSRLIMLDNLLRSAVDYGELGHLSEALDALLCRRDQALTKITAELDLDLFVAPWRLALTRARTLTQTLAAHAAPPPQPVHPEHPKHGH